MSRQINKLTVKGIERLPTGTHGDGGGLWLRRNSPTSAQWLFRFRLHGRTRQMGLGSYPLVSLAKARKARDRCAEQVALGIDPVLERRREKNQAKTQLVTLAQVAEAAFEARMTELKNDSAAGRWFGPLKLHVLPKIGKVPAVDVTQIHIRDAVSPIWKTKADTARKAMNRLNITLKHAAALGLDVDLLAVEKAKALLGKQDHKAKNIPAMPWREVPAFYCSLQEDTPTQLALRLLILNPGPRSKPIRFLRTEHIKGDVWTVPGELMKGLKGKVDDWRTPLSPQSVKLIEKARRWERNGYLFPNASGRGVISDATMARHMERTGLCGPSSK
ncbi:MAG: Arm DNA-binding domain-containing protein [Pseudomonadota bacterium]